MRFDILSLFPEMFHGPFDESIIRRARDKGLISINLHQIREFTLDKHHTVDDAPYGGGAGMVMKPEPLAACIEHARQLNPGALVVAACPTGERFSQRIAVELSRYSGLIILCGRYEGIDERVRSLLVDRSISIGDYVLSGGELAAMVMVDTVTRLLPGALGSEDSARNDSFSDGLLEYPQYTRPPCFRGLEVPEVLLSGDHSRIERWRRKEALRRTRTIRPDLLQEAELSTMDRRMLAELEVEHG